MFMRTSILTNLFLLKNRKWFSWTYSKIFGARLKENIIEWCFLRWIYSCAFLRKGAFMTLSKRYGGTFTIIMSENLLHRFFLFSLINLRITPWWSFFGIITWKVAYHRRLTCSLIGLSISSWKLDQLKTTSLVCLCMYLLWIFACFLFALSIALQTLLANYGQNYVYLRYELLGCKH